MSNKDITIAIQDFAKKQKDSKYPLFSIIND